MIFATETHAPIFAHPDHTVSLCVRVCADCLAYLILPYLHDLKQTHTAALTWHAVQLSVLDCGLEKLHASLPNYSTRQAKDDCQRDQ